MSEIEVSMWHRGNTIRQRISEKQEFTYELQKKEYEALA